MKKSLALSLLAISLGFSASLPSGAPEQNGMSSERLNRINGVMNKHVDAGDLAGASGLISRHGKIVFRGTWGGLQGRHDRPHVLDDQGRHGSRGHDPL